MKFAPAAFYLALHTTFVTCDIRDRKRRWVLMCSGQTLICGSSILHSSLPLEANTALTLWKISLLLVRSSFLHWLAFHGSVLWGVHEHGILEGTGQGRRRLFSLSFFFFWRRAAKS